MSKFFCCGLDLGQAADYTALVVAEKDGTQYAVRHIERFQLGTTYPAIVDRVSGMLQGPPLRGCSRLICDATGVGRPVVDMFRKTGLAPLAISITSGLIATQEGSNWTVPKRDLVSTVKVLLQAGRLRIADKLPTAELLVKELLSFQVKITTAANDTYGAWREGQHDDLVLALAVALYFGESIRHPEIY